MVTLIRNSWISALRCCPVKQPLQVLAVQVLLTIACIGALKPNRMPQRQATMYQMMAAPLVGREGAADRWDRLEGRERRLERNWDRPPTLSYALSKDWPNRERNRAATRLIRALSPTRLRIVYIDTVDLLIESYLRQHGMADEIVVQGSIRPAPVSFSGAGDAAGSSSTPEAGQSKRGAFLADFGRADGRYEKRGGRPVAMRNGGE